MSEARSVKVFLLDARDAVQIRALQYLMPRFLYMRLVRRGAAGNEGCRQLCVVGCVQKHILKCMHLCSGCFK